MVLPDTAPCRHGPIEHFCAAFGKPKTEQPYSEFAAWKLIDTSKRTHAS
jgi:hypothetical protein